MENRIPVDFNVLEPKDRLALALGSPAPFFVTGEDAIQLSAINSATGVTLTLAGRFMQLNGTITPFVHTLVPTTNRVVTSQLTALGDGFILNFSVIATAGAPAIGQCWARVQVFRGLTGATTQLGALVSGYVTAQQPIAFPSGKARSSLDGPGCIRGITGADPAAGANWTVPVPAGARWRIMSIFATLVTSATAADRLPILVVNDGTNQVFRSDPAAAQSAGLTRGYVASAGSGRLASVAVAAQWTFPNDFRLGPGSNIFVSTLALEVDDDWGAPQLLVEEWLEGA